MAKPQIAIVRTGTANLASVRAAFRRLGLATRLAEADKVIRSATHLVLPGVGAFRPAMERLRDCGLTGALRDHITADKPALCVCLGLQLLCETSAESPGVNGLGIIAGGVTRLEGTVRVPHLGWNRVQAAEPSQFLTSGHAYFANSFKLDRAPAGWLASHVEYGGSWVAALERGNTLACQFHPELSGSWGLALLKRWLAHSGRKRGTPC